MHVRKLIYGANSPYENFRSDPDKVDLQGWGSDHPIFAREIKSRSPSLILEVGTWKGRSACHMARIARDLGLKTEIVCIDTWLGNWQHWSRRSGVGSIDDLKLVNGYPHLFYTFLNNVISSDLSAFITPLALPGYSGFKLLEHYKIQADMVYIDGDHEYDAVLLDLKTYWQLVRPGGILIGDDIAWPGVQRAAKEVFEDQGIPIKVEKGKFSVTKPAPAVAPG